MILPLVRLEEKRRIICIYRYDTAAFVNPRPYYVLLGYDCWNNDTKLISLQHMVRTFIKSLILIHMFRPSPFTWESQM